MAADWLDQIDDGEDWMESQDWATVLRYRAAGNLIRPGDRYLYQVTKDWAGELCVFRAIPALDEICWKYDIYEEE
jgi:hypothetical protein